MARNIADQHRYNELLERLKIIDDELNKAHQHHEGEAVRNLERERKAIQEEIEKFGQTAAK